MLVAFMITSVVLVATTSTSSLRLPALGSEGQVWFLSLWRSLALRDCLLDSLFAIIPVSTHALLANERCSGRARVLMNTYGRRYLRRSHLN